MLAGQVSQELLAFHTALLLDAQLLIPLEALRVELSVPIRGERPATSAAMVLMALRGKRSMSHQGYAAGWRPVKSEARVK